METLILNSSSKQDIKLLLDIAKKLGLQLKVADRRDLILAEALQLNNSVKRNKISASDIIEECSEVRRQHHIN